MANLDSLNTSSQLASQLRQLRPQGASGSGVINQGGNALPQNVANSVDATPAQQPDTQQIETAVARISDFVQSIQRDLSFAVNDDTGQTIITVRDSQTDEVIRQIPSELLVQLAQNLNELQEKLESSKGNLLEVRV